MLRLLLKIFLFLAAILGVTFVAIQIGEWDETLQVIVGGNSYELRPLDIAVGLILLMLIGWALFRLIGVLVAVIRFLLGNETALDRYFARSRSRKGYKALGEGLLAVAAGEGREARQQADRAAKFLNAPHLTNVLKAQAAEISGDDQAAEDIYRQMLDDQRTRFVAIRGLMQQRLLRGDTDTALALAQKAYALKPNHVAVQDTLLGLQAQAHDWKGARAVLRTKRKQGQLPADVALRRDAVLAVQEAREVLAEGASISAREAAISANRASPDLVPAAVLAARSYLARGDSRNAARILQKSWADQPHPSLAAAYAEIAPDETPAERLRRFDALIRKNPDHAESHLLKAELMLAAEDFPGARRALGDLATTDPTVRSLSIMAAVERGEGADESVVRGWLARALTASRGPQWVCDNCQHVMGEWAPVCDNCGALDTLAWRVPPEQPGDSIHVSAAAMLPLIIGPPSPPPAPETESEVEVITDPTPDQPAPDDAAETTAPTSDQPRVEPGMVPRESDYAPPRPDVEPTGR